MLSRDNELAIDLYRGAAALLVFVSHMLPLIVEPVLGQDLYTWPLGWQILGCLFGGRFWVRFFFVISGFCIHQSISRSLERRRFDPRPYALARLTRIYPVFLVGLGLALLNWWWFAPGGKEAVFPVKELVATLLMLQQIVGTFPGLGPSWSLTSEMFYYAAWPLALFLCSFQQRVALWRSACLTLLVTLAVVAVWKVVYGGDRTHWLIPIWSITGLFFVWLGGAWLAIEWEAVRARVTRRVWIFGIAWVLAMNLVEAALIFYQARSWPFMLVDYLATPGFIIVIAGGHYFRLSTSSRWESFARWLGTLSYPCYLLHVVTFALVRSVMGMLFLPVHPVLQMLLAAGVTALVIAFPGVALERASMEWRSRYLKRLMPRA